MNLSHRQYIKRIRYSILKFISERNERVKILAIVLAAQKLTASAQPHWKVDQERHVRWEDGF